MSHALPSSIPAGHVLLRVAFAGVNASDVNFSSGRYHPSIEQAQASLPFDAGFEAVGAVAAVGQQVSGSPFAVMQTTSMTHVHARLSYTFCIHTLQECVLSVYALSTQMCSIGNFESNVAEIAWQQAVGSAVAQAAMVRDMSYMI